MDTWRSVMYKYPEARAILSKRKNCVLLHPDEDSGAHLSDDDEYPDGLRSSRRLRRPSLRKRQARSSQQDTDLESQSPSDSEWSGDGEESDSIVSHSYARPQTYTYSDTESRGRNNGVYTLGDMKALVSLLVKHPELETLSELRAGELIEKNVSCDSPRAHMINLIFLASWVYAVSRLGGKGSRGVNLVRGPQIPW